MKKYLSILTIVLINILFVGELNALEGYTTDTYVGLRTGPGTNYDRVKQIDSKNTVLDLVSDELYNVGDKACSSGWYKLKYNNEELYICGLYVSIGSPPGTGKEDYNTDSFEARINGVNIQLRKAASYSSTLLATLLPGTNVKIIGSKVTGSGCAEGFYKITTDNGVTGYVCSKFVLTKEEMTKEDEEYTKYLISLGFPEDYTPYLNKLHSMHPNWTFKPVKTNYYWDTVVTKEDDNVALINYANDLYRVDNIGLDGANWYRAKKEVVAFYLDPRNFLTEKFIFMFESLKYNYGSGKESSLNKDSEITKRYYDTISKIFSGSFLNTDYYKFIYIDAGFQHNISPVHLATRSNQEGATKESYVAVSGTYTELYKGYNLQGLYNFYNIGAYARSGYPNPVLNGLIYACGSRCGGNDTYGRPWNERYKAIYGGAQKIANNYIAAGQYTLYTQRFNVDPSALAPNFTNQYQTNILAPTSESADAYSAYKDMNLLDEPFEFYIPVYLNMPKTVSLPTTKSSVTTLESISINGKTVTSFDKDLLEQTIYVEDGLDKYNISVTPTSSNVTITGTGLVTLTGTKTLHEITVTSESGNSRTYKLTIIKVKDTTTVNDIISKLSVKTNDTLMFNISPETLVSTLIQSINKQNSNAIVNIYESSGSASSSSDLIKTNQKIKITVPSGESRTYTLIVTGDTSGDGKVTILDLLQLQKHLLGSSVLNSVQLKSADTNLDGTTNILDLLRIQKHILGSIRL